MIRRKVPCAGHLMTPRRLWLNKIPTQCDVVIEFPEDAPDNVLRWLLGRLRGPHPEGLGLLTHVRAHESTKRHAFYISAPNTVLYKAAEDARLPKRLRGDLGFALKEFTKREAHCFAQSKDSDGNSTLFTSQERQWLVLQVLQSLRACPEDMGILQDRARVEEGQSIIAAWQDSGLIEQVFPLHETSALTQLQTNWVRKMFAPQPLDDIAEYFGVKVALYFAWLGHYTCALCVPAVLGTLLWAGLWGRGQTAQDIGHILFSLFNVTWASLYLEAWRRYSVELAFRWGTLSTPPELLEPPRPLYKGPLEESPVTGRLEPREAPAWQRRAFRYFVSFPIIGLCLAAVFVVMFLMLQLQDWLDHKIYTSVSSIWSCFCMRAPKDWWDEKLPESGIISCLSVIPKVLLAGAITLMDEAYYKLAVWLNDKENYRLQSKYENHLIGKVALFQFVNSFLSLFYIAFYLRDEEKLKEQLAGLLISRQIIGNLRESAFPYFMEQWKLASMSFKLWGALSPTQETAPEITDNKKNDDAKTGSSQTVQQQQQSVSTQGQQQLQSHSSTEHPAGSPKRSIGQAEIESTLYKYDGTFSDHLEMLVQMGYVVLFSAAFPLAGLCALINNLIEIRSDAFKLAHVHQRPFGQRVANIGTWQNALGLLGLAAVIVNCALIGLSGQVSRLWPGLTSTQTVLLIVALEHIMLGLRSALTWILPELPSWLAAEIARAEHCRREMQCKGPSPRPTPPSPLSSTSLSHEQDHSTPEQFEKMDSFDSQHRAEPYSRKPSNTLSMRFQDPNYHYEPRRSVDNDLSRSATREVTPDSPISQTSTVLMRPLFDSPTLPHPPPAAQPLVSTISSESSPQLSGAACKIVKKASTKQPFNLVDIPPFKGRPSSSSLHSHFNEKKTSTGSQSSTSSHQSQRTASQPMQIPEIPPFVKKSHQQSTMSLASHIPSASSSSTASASVAVSASSNTNTSNSSGSQSTAMRHNYGESTVTHKSIEGPTTVGKISDIPPYDPVRPKRSKDWTPLPLDVEHHLTIGRSGGAEWIRRLKASDAIQMHKSTECIVAKQAQEVTTESDPELMKPAPSWANLTVKLDDVASTSAPTAKTLSEEEQKAAEMAAKKSRLKKKLVKSARSVAIFSLKLKERRAREAERIAMESAELHTTPAPCGEMDAIPIEKLLQVDDVIKNKAAHDYK